MPLLSDFNSEEECIPVTDHAARFPLATAHLTEWLKEGKITYSETIMEGFDKLPESFIGLFEGKNEGKMIVKI